MLGDLVYHLSGHESEWQRPKVLGRGEQGTVYEVNNDWVLKICNYAEADVGSMISEDQEDDLLRGFPVIPLAARLDGGLGLIVAERLERLARDERQYIDAMVMASGRGAIDLRSLRRPVRSARSKPEVEVRDRLIRLMKAVGDWVLFDVNGGNVMCRGDEYVLADLGMLNAPYGDSPFAARFLDENLLDEVRFQLEEAIERLRRIRCARSYRAGQVLAGEPAELTHTLGPTRWESGREPDRDRQSKRSHQPDQCSYCS